MFGVGVPESAEAVRKIGGFIRERTN
jgi:hypothetical protein